MTQAEFRVFQTAKPFRNARRNSALALVGFVGLSLLAAVVGGLAGSGWPPSVVMAAPMAVYGVVGVSAWLVWRQIEVGAERKRTAMRVWGWQLLAGAVWFASGAGLHGQVFGGVAALAFVAGLGLTATVFWPLQRGAAVLTAAYGCGVIFATYLCIAFWWPALG